MPRDLCAAHRWPRYIAKSAILCLKLLTFPEGRGLGAAEWVRRRTVARRVPRSEYPRPTLVRPEWINLNGAWRFDFDEDRRGLGLAMLARDYRATVGATVAPSGEGGKNAVCLRVALSAAEVEQR